jgi:hypothetical protein
MQMLLRPHVHFCVTDHGGVFLDLKRDRYFGVTLEHAPSLRAALAGATPASGQSTFTAFLEDLQHNGLLTSDRSQGHPWLPVDLAVAEQTLLEQWTEDRPNVRFAQLLKLAIAYTVSRATLRIGTQRAVYRVRNRNLRRAHRAPALDPEVARRLLSVYLYLRPLLFTAHDHCFLDSMVLIEFLALHGVYANWVFGVKLAPFAAHCWVQHGSYIFNGRPESVGSYTRLLVV